MKMKKISLIIALIAFIFAITLSVLPVNLNYNSVKLHTFLQKAIADDEWPPLQTKWSDDIKCNSPCPGDYNVCRYLEDNNDCENWGATTCTCCVNCM